MNNIKFKYEKLLENGAYTICYIILGLVCFIAALLCHLVFKVNEQIVTILGFTVGICIASAIRHLIVAIVEARRLKRERNNQGT